MNEIAQIEPPSAAAGPIPARSSMPRKRTKICGLLSLGYSRSMAAEYVGCDPSTITRTAKRDERFREQLAAAQSEADIDALKLIRHTADQERYWRAAAWILERRNPDEYGRRAPNTFSGEQVMQILDRVLQAVMPAVAAEKRAEVMCEFEEELGDVAEKARLPLPEYLAAEETSATGQGHSSGSIRRRSPSQPSAVAATFTISRAKRRSAAAEEYKRFRRKRKTRSPAWNSLCKGGRRPRQPPTAGDELRGRAEMCNTFSKAKPSIAPRCHVASHCKQTTCGDTWPSATCTTALKGVAQFYPRLDQRRQRRQADRLAAGERLAVAVPIDQPQRRRLIAEPVDERGRLRRAAVDELAAIALDGRALPLPIVADVQHERRLRNDPQVDAVVIEDPLGIERLAGHVGLGELRPEAGGLDQFRGGHVVGMGVDPIGGENPSRPLRRNTAASFARASSVGSRLRLGRPRFSRQSRPSTGRRRGRFAGADFRRAERRRLAVGQIEHADGQPSALNFMIAPAMPSSASSGWGATTRTSSIVYITRGFLIFAECSTIMPYSREIR